MGDVSLSTGLAFVPLFTIPKEKESFLNASIDGIKGLKFANCGSL